MAIPMPTLLRGEPMSTLVTKTDTISEVLNRFAFNSNATPMWVFDKSTFAFLPVNGAAGRVYGYSRKEVLPMTILDIRSNEDIIPLLRNELLQGIHNSQNALRRYESKDGSAINVEITSRAVLFSGRRAKIVAAMDAGGHNSRPDETSGIRKGITN
jgi:PAS domain S-box-containing protein